MSLPYSDPAIQPATSSDISATVRWSFQPCANQLRFFDTTPANVRAFFILRVKQCRPRPFFPVFRTFKEHHGTFHAVFNTLRITTGAAFAVMPHKNGLTGRDHRGQSFHFIKCLCGFTGPLSAVSGKPLRPCFLTFSERAVFILNLSGK